jgi:hypothetical protein
MKPWDVAGDYSRPICRRILEEKGVPRELFGQRKNAAGEFIYRTNSFLTPGSKADYLAWLKEHRIEWIKHGRIPPIEAIDSCLNDFLGAGQSCSRWTEKIPDWRGTGRLKSAVESISKQINGGLSAHPIYLRRYTFPWALEKAKKRYIQTPLASGLAAEQ